MNARTLAELNERRRILRSTVSPAPTAGDVDHDRAGAREARCCDGAASVVAVVGNLRRRSSAQGPTVHHSSPGSIPGSELGGQGDAPPQTGASPSNVRTVDARLVDHCSVTLELYGATPVPPADPSFRLPTQGAPATCSGCHHPRNEHGATGECWHLADFTGPDCRCGRDQIARRAS